MISPITLATAFVALISLAQAAPTKRQAGIDFGSCGSPEIEFKDGLDGRKEPAFIATDQQSYNHGSALNIVVITSFIIDRLGSNCKAPAATIAIAQSAASDAQAAGGKNGAAADAWNAKFGITTNFAGGGSPAPSASLPTETQVVVTSAPSPSSPSSATVSECPAAVTVTVTAGAEAVETAISSAPAPAATATPASPASPVEGIDVGPCTDFSMVFKAGLDNRGAAFSFEPSDLVQFPHTSALNPAIISEFMCDTFVNACARSATTRDTCKGVKATIDGQLASGALARDQSYADAWLSGLEEAFGIQSTGTGTQGQAELAPVASSAPAVTATAAPDAPAPSAAPTTGNAAAGIDVGSCTDFSMVFEANLDNRGDTKSFEPSDIASFPHTSALNPAIISEFMCDSFVNICGKSATTRDVCKVVKVDIDSKLAAGTLARDQSYADAWLDGLESAFGITSTGRGTGA